MHARPTPRRPASARMLLALAAALLATLLVAPQGSAAPATVVTLIYDTRSHGELADGELSLAHYAALANRLRSQKPNTLFLGSGDDLAPGLLSSIFKGEQAVAALNAAGLDFNTYGNHEFAYGPDNLLERVAQSEFTWVSANVIDRRSGDVFGKERGALRYAVVSFGDLRVAVTGVAPANTAEIAETGDHVVILDPVEALASVVPEMREQASLVVVLSQESWEAAEKIAAAVPGIDVMIGGRSGRGAMMIGGTLVSQAGETPDYLGELTLTIAGGAVAGWTFASHDVRALVASGALYPDTTVRRAIDRYAQLAQASMEEVIGYTLAPLDARNAYLRRGETALGNFIADSLREWAGADVALLNSGGIRGDRIYEPGPLTRGTILAILPFSNHAVKLNVQGKTIVEALEHGVGSVESEHGRFPQVSGLAFEYDPSLPAGSRVGRVWVGGVEIDPEAWYTLATDDFVAGGGDGYYMLADAERLIPPEAGPLISTIVLEAIAARGEIAPETDDRIIELESAPADEPLVI